MQRLITSVMPLVFGVYCKQLLQPGALGETIQRLVADGVEAFVEVGPGRVLAGLIKRISRKVKVVGFQEMEELEKVLEMA